ncbi:MAG: acylneuraminate cytidylyltransferase [Verrucomicrobiales bacterium]|nr:acylneuraminate cytidylyltransferase [Verrucomicrobiales bacterium]
MSRDTTVIVPVRKGSQRIIHKNIRPVAGFRYGLMEIKLRQLLATGVFDQILVDTDLEEMGEMMDYITGGVPDPRVRVEPRDPRLAGSDATTDDLIRHLVTKVRTTHMVWTHVTSPFFTAECYRRFMTAYHERPETADSLVAVDVLREFLWTKGGPMNYDRSKLRWPFTQTLEPVYLINSAAFAIPVELARKVGDRLGDSPAFFECETFEGFDVDWPAQFQVVESLVKNGYPVL